MATIQVFIASSSRDTGHERLVVSDAVRKLSEQYETQGYRVRLGCWEDFTPEYSGTRKQTEYNEQLIAKSQVFIALFRSVCGQYSQEEVHYWQSLGNEPFVLDIQDTSVDKTAVSNFVASCGLSTLQVQTDDDIVAAVVRMVDDYISGHPADGHIETAPVKKVYATIPYDRKEERLPVSHIVRSLDDMAESRLHLRCRLMVLNSAQLVSSDYYAAILKDHLNHDEEAEVLTAVHYSVSLHRPEVALYYNYYDQILDNHPEVKSAINNAGLFNEPFDGVQRVRYNLLKWILRQSVLRIDLGAGICVKEGWFFFYGLPVIALSEIGISATTEAAQTAELIKRLSFAVLDADGSHLVGADGNLEVDDIDAEIDKADTIINAAQEIEQAATERKRTLLNTIAGAIDAILTAGVTHDNIAKLMVLIERKERLQTELSIESREILRTQMLVVQVHDTYTVLFQTTGINIDRQYLKVAETADHYGIVDPTAEMMRMNYANYLSRQNRNGEAIRMYETVMTRLDSLDDRSELYRYYIVHLYVTYINHLAFLAEKARATAAIARLDGMMARWKNYGLSDLERTANRSRLMACKLRIRPIQEGVTQLLNEALLIYKHALSLPEEAFDSFIRDEIFCDLPICIASTLMDALQNGVRLNEKQVGHNVTRCLENVIRFTYRYPNDISCLTYRGNAFHDLGFFYSNTVGDQQAARRYCKEALDVRERIYTLTQNPNDQYDVAQTLLLLGATYVNDRREPLTIDERDEALGYADRCLAIYADLNKEHYLEQDTRYYEALQLKGSILYASGGTGKAIGLTLLKQVRDWDVAHPENTYHGTFQEVARSILKAEGWIG